MLSKDFFDEWGKKRLETLIREGKMPDQIIVGFSDPFGNSDITSCSEEHNVKVVCVCCVDPKDLKGQIATDFANIEKQIEEKKR